MPRWEFPELPTPSIFVGSPGDMAYLRELVKTEFESLQEDAARQDLQLYLWEDEDARDSFEVNRPYQGSIPKPSDGNCRAAIFLFGERIGSPLPSTFPIEDLVGTPARSAYSRNTLLHPWSPSVSASQFPLTGTTFEYLLCEMMEKPILILFMGDESLFSDKDVSDQNWGNGRLREQKEAEYGKHSRTSFLEWEQAEYRPQLSSLRSFFRYVSRDQSRPIRLVSDIETARGEIRTFLKRQLGSRVRRVPFKYLASYGVEDSSVFFGRKGECEEIVQDINERAQNCTDAHTPVFRIYGSSGSGKSSLMRAGVIARLANCLKGSRWVPYVVRPIELTTLPVGENDPLLQLYADCLASIDEKSDRYKAMADLAQTGRSGRPRRAVTNLVVALNERAHELGQEIWRLVLGVDQFEEILIELAAVQDGPDWRGVLTFLNIASATGRIAVLYTIPSARVVELSQSRELLEFSLKGGSKEIGFPSDTIGEIIDRSFSESELELEPQLRERMLDSIATITDADSRVIHESLLPLISLAMSRMHERWEKLEREPEVAVQTAAEADMAADSGGDRLSTEFEVTASRKGQQACKSSTRVMTLDTYGDLAELATVINLEGDSAVLAAKAAARGLTVDPEEVGNLLRHMVRFLPGKERTFDLLAISPPRDLSLLAIANALRHSRLITEIEGGRLRLVHEAVLHHWNLARDWVGREHDSLEYVSGLAGPITAWEASARSILGSEAEHDVDRAAEILYVWATALTPVAEDDSVDEFQRRLREFLIAIIKRVSTPSSCIPELSSRPTHFHAAVAVNAVDLVSSIVATDPAMVRLKKEDQRTALFEAAFFERHEIIDIMLQAGCPADDPDVDGWLPLHAASTKARCRAVQSLLPFTTDVDARGPQGTTALLLAVRTGHEPTAKALISHGANINTADATQMTALHYSVTAGHYAVTKVLVSAGADVNARSADGWAPLHLAAREGYGGVTALLLDAETLETTACLHNGCNALHIAAKGGHAGVARILIDHWKLDVEARGSNVWDITTTRSRHSGGNTNQGWSALHFAAAYGMETTVRLLVDSLADLNAKTKAGQTPLHLAAAMDRRGALEVLLSRHSIDIETRDTEGKTPLYAALSAEHYAAATILIRAGSDTNALQAKREMAIHEASRRGNPALIEFLLRSGANPNAKDHRQRTPLHLAAEYGHRNIAAMLLPHAEVNARSDRGSTPLHLAARHGHLDLIRLLIANHAEVDVLDNSEQTPLHCSAQEGHEEAATALLLNGANVNAADSCRWTALHCASQNGHLQVVQLLLEWGADHAMFSQHPSVTALQAAAEAGQEACVTKLLAHNSDLHARTQDRSEPLVLAIKNSHYRAALLLCRWGASMNNAQRSAEALDVFMKRWHLRRITGQPVTQAEAALACILDADTHYRIVPELGVTAADLTGDTRPSFGHFICGEWPLIDSHLRSSVCRRMDELEGKYYLDDPETQVSWTRLPFYGEAVRLIRFTKPSWHPNNLRLFCLLRGEEIFWLRGQSPVLHNFNATAPLILNEDNVLDYLRFFCFFVRGEEGPYLITESAADPLLPREAGVQAILEGVVRPCSFEGLNEQGFYLCDGILYYSNAVFIANFSVQPGGMVEMLDDEPVAADLSMKIDSPIE